MPTYTALEKVGQKGYNRVKADAWSCSVIHYIFLTGFLPFNDANKIRVRSVGKMKDNNEIRLEENVTYVFYCFSYTPWD